MNKIQLSASIIIVGMVLGGIMAITGTPGAWFPWTVSILTLLFT